MNKIFLDISIYAIAITAIKMLIPDNTFKKQLDFIITCTFLLGISFLITNNNYDFDIESIFKTENPKGHAYFDYSDQLTRVQKREIASEIAGRLDEKFSAQNIHIDEISVIVNISDEGGISINEIMLVLPEGVDAKLAERLVKSEVGAKVKVQINYESERET